MTTNSWSTRVRHDSDATFRDWGSEFSAKLLAVGLTQTGDTGQIDWLTVARPGSSTEGGYEIWRFNDTEHGTSPIFMRVGYGTAAGLTSPRIQISVGTGSSGAGVLTGVTSAVNSILGSQASITDTARQSYMCYVAGTTGFFGVLWKSDMATSFDPGFLITRTCNASGVATSTGAIVVWGGNGPAAVTASQAFRLASVAVAYPQQTAVTSTALCLSPQTRSSSSVGADLQAFVCYTVTPQVEPLVGMCGIVDTEVSVGSTFTATLVGSTARTYIGLSGKMGCSGSATIANNGPKFAMLWE